MEELKKLRSQLLAIKYTEETGKPSCFETASPQVKGGTEIHYVYNLGHRLMVTDIRQERLERG